jgi:hypothetical protein
METKVATPSDLLRARAAHMDNLQRLRHAMPTLSAPLTQRAENTMANLMQQVYEIDEQLRIKGKKPDQWGAA